MTTTMFEATTLKDKTRNQVNVLYPYRSQYGIWAFDDAEVALNGEPFVGDINRMIDMFVDGATECTVYISREPIAKQTLKLNRVEEGEGFYILDGTDVQGWLCPATLKYFDVYPENIYARIEKRKKK